MLTIAYYGQPGIEDPMSTCAVRTTLGQVDMGKISRKTLKP